MRAIFFLPDLFLNRWHERAHSIAYRRKLLKLPQVARALALGDPPHITGAAHGGTLNIMRHALVARDAGFDAWIATPSGRDTYGVLAIPGSRYMRYADRKPEDLIMIPDNVSFLTDEIQGPAIVYEQAPHFVRTDFDFRRPNVEIWTDSPFMLDVCQRTFPGKQVDIVPNVVDDRMFPFVPQERRKRGLLFAFPRKGPEFIDAAERIYQERGGKYFRFERVDGLGIHELAIRFREPQVFLASAESEGCALPPQEAMASGIVVVGRSAKGANFSMKHRETAMVAETPEAAVDALFELEDISLCKSIADNGYAFIRHCFWNAEPADLWRKVHARYSV
jgi:hypothetical protein